MFISINRKENLEEAFEKVGLTASLHKDKSALIKINLARPPEPGHPRTDPALLAEVVRYVVSHGACCAIAEGADGFLQENIKQAGLEQVIKENRVRVIDLDMEDFDPVSVDNEEHYLPKCLRNYAIRIGMPALSKRPGMLFSNNIKLFVGAVPRGMYQLGEQTAGAAAWRPRLHLDLHRSVANVYQAVMKYAPFDFFINGGTTMIEGRGEMDMEEILIGDNALELDRHWLKQVDLQMPEYIARLSELELITEDT